ncbi:MAG: holo-ACP synthase [Lachnospiraceae bacterium]|nr:holo-ACP synthase [Lachnospiraceae bacterium]
MIVGIGVDTIEIARVVHSCEREHFVNRIFTPGEIAQFDKNKRRAASDFAGKEAVVKVFGTGFQEIEAREIEILRGDLGEPQVKLYGKAKKKAEELQIHEFMISITNTKELATAFVIGIRR